MKHFFQATLKAHIELSDDDFLHICECCKGHYDFTVSSCVEVRGFLYGLKNRRDFSDGEDKVADLTIRQIGLILKAFEMYPSAKTFKLAQQLNDIAGKLMLKETEINESLLNQ